MPTELPAGLVALLGVFAPIIIQFVTRLVPNKLGRYLIALVLSAITGIGAMAWAGIDWNVTVEFICMWYTFAQIAFHLFWQPLYNATGILALKKK